MDPLNSQTEEAFAEGDSNFKIMQEGLRSAQAKRLEKNIKEAKETGKFLYESLPGISTAITAQDITEELQKENPSYAKIALLGGSELIGLIPQLGVPAKAGLRVAAKKVGLNKVVDALDAVKVNQLPIDETLDTKTASNITDEDLKAWKDSPSNTTSDARRKQLKGRDDELMALATEYQDSLAANGAEASKDLLVKYRKAVDKINPIRPIETMPELISNIDVVGALGEKTNILGKKKTGILGVNRQFKQGEVVTSRLDINGYTNHDKWVAAVRTTEDVVEDVSPTAYGKAVYLKNVNMLQPEGLQKKSLRIATGKEKGPHAVMEGAYQQQSPEEIYEYAKSVFEDSLKPDSEWVQIGYNPVRAGYFYDRATGLPLEAAEEVIQVGNLVLGRKVTKGDIESYMFNEGGLINSQEDQMQYPNGVVVNKNNEEIGFTLDGNLFLDDKGVNSLSKGINDIPEGKTISISDGPSFTSYSLDNDLSNYLFDMTKKISDTVELDTGSASLRYKIGEDSKIYIENADSDNPTIGYKYSKSFAKGGLTMSQEDQMKTMFKTSRGYAEGGIAETVDPVSGNDVPPGSLPAEVRDDVPAQLSEGEYVIPADVVRYFGVKTFEDMRMEAKQGMSQMDAEGRIGGDTMQEEALPFSDDELITSDVPEDNTMAAMNEGGVVYAQQGVDLSQYEPPDQQAKVTYKTYVNAAGMEIIVPFLGEDAMGAIPPGYTLKGEVGQTTQEDTSNNNDDPNDGAAMAAKTRAEKPERIDYSTTTDVDELKKGISNYYSFGGKLMKGLATAINPLAGIGVKLSQKNTFKDLQTGISNIQDADQKALLQSLISDSKEGEAARASEYEKSGGFGGTFLGDLLGFDEGGFGIQNDKYKTGSGGDRPKYKYDTPYSNLSSDPVKIGKLNLGTERDAYEYAVKSGNDQIVKHFEAIDRLRNKQKLHAAGKPTEGLSDHDKIQALKKYSSGDTVSSNQPEEDSAPKPHPTFGYVKGGLVKRPKKRKVNK